MSELATHFPCTLSAASRCIPAPEAAMEAVRAVNSLQVCGIPRFALEMIGVQQILRI